VYLTLAIVDNPMSVGSMSELALVFKVIC